MTRGPQEVNITASYVAGLPGVSEQVDPFWRFPDGQPATDALQIESTLDVGGLEVLELSHGPGVDLEIPEDAPIHEALKDSDIGDLDDYLTQVSLYCRIGGWEVQVVGSRGTDRSTLIQFIDAIELG